MLVFTPLKLTGSLTGNGRTPRLILPIPGERVNGNTDIPASLAGLLSAFQG
jgi:hypothetical protein